MSAQRGGVDTTAVPTMLPGSFTIGSYVNVDKMYICGSQDSDGGIGVVLKLEPRSCVTVRYCVGNRTEKGVARERLHHHVLTMGPRTPPPSAAAAASSSTTLPKPVVKPHPCLYELSLKWRPGGSTAHPLAAVLNAGRSKPAGWRRADPGTGEGAHGLSTDEGAQGSSKRKKAQLAPAEMARFSFEMALLSPPPAVGCMRDLEHAWGVGVGYGGRAVVRYANRDFDGGRQERSDAGRSMVTDPEFAKSKCTGREQYVRELVAQPSAGAGGGLDLKQLREEYAALPPSDQLEYEQRAELRRLRVPFWHDEIKASLVLTNGKVPWHVIAASVGGDLSEETVRRFVMSLAGFSYKASKTVPLLGDGHVLQRLTWAWDFWLFWHEAKRLTKSVLLVHADEKWFWACVGRKKDKAVVEFGVEPADFKVQHKSHVFKIMACAVSGCLFAAGDIEGGGKGYKVAFERCGDFEKAEKTTHKRRYIGGGKWKMDGEISRKAGDLYFVGHEVTGACEGGKTGDKGTRCAVCVERGSSCVKTKKWSTLKFMRDVCFPVLEDICKEENCIVRWQFDGAGPHKDAFLLEWIDREFRARGWIFIFQPSQSPETNTKDACIFPSLSRGVSVAQAVTYGHNHVLRGEELWRAMEQSWKDMSCATIARSFAGHHQVVTAIIEDDGSNTFLRGKDHMHFGVRKRFVTTPEGDGVEVLADVDPEEMQSYTLKYAAPTVDTTCATSRLNALERAALYGDDVPWVPEQPPPPKKKKGKKRKEPGDGHQDDE